ncbi:MAG TPA: APC family permease [Steroidobacteraceae bacterium]|jgi:amino acid transporter|nr:APC family permease [Steroidobacteraceae bacterium]
MNIPSTSVLSRRLTPWSAALFGLSYICPTVVFSTFGILARATEGATASAYATATAAILLTAGSYARMSARWPDSGSAYTYVSNTVNDAFGFLAGWLLILDYFLVPMVICLFTAKACEMILPHVDYRLWIVLIAAFTTAVNVLGIQVANRVNLAIAAAQFAVIAILILLCIWTLSPSGRGAQAWTAAPFFNSRTSLPLVMSGAAVAAYSFLGFDAVTTLAEETLDPTRSIPRATLFAAAASGFIYIVCSYFMGLVHPSIEFRDVDNAGYEILSAVSGAAFPWLLAIVLCAFVASIMCAQAGSSRLLYAMARDGTLPKAALTYVHPRFRTPVTNICLLGAAMIAGIWLDVEAAASCVNFGAFAAFTAVNLSVIYDHTAGQRALPGGMLKLAQAAAGAVATLWLMASLHRAALMVGSAWLLAGAVYLMYRRLRSAAEFSHNIP